MCTTEPFTSATASLPGRARKALAGNRIDVVGGGVGNNRSRQRVLAALFDRSGDGKEFSLTLGWLARTPGITPRY